MARKGVDVTSRSGYFALPANDAAPLLPYELPLLAAAAATPPPHAFDFHAGVFRFHETTRGRQFTLVTEVPVASLAVEEDKKAKQYHIRFTVMALVKDANGTVVERLSNTYPLEGPLENLPALQRGNVIFKRQLWLGPGRYTLTTVVRDQQADKVSVRQLPLRVFPEAPGIDVSTVAVVKRVDKASDEPDPVEDPFRDGPMRIAPSLATPISKAANSQISAFVVLYPDKAIADAPNLTIEFAQGSTIVGRSSPALDKPDEHGPNHLRRDVPGGWLRAGHLRAAGDRAAGRVAGRVTDDLHHRRVGWIERCDCHAIGAPPSSIARAGLRAVVGRGNSGGATAGSARNRTRARVPGPHHGRPPGRRRPRQAGRPVLDLRPDEITVLENGVARDVRSFRLVDAGTGVAADAAAPAGATHARDSTPRVTLISLVFDHLGQNARQLALKAAQDYLKTPLPGTHRVAVFSLDQRLRMLQGFTRDAEALSAAVTRATSSVLKEDAPALPGASRERAGDTAYAKVGDSELSATERSTIASDNADPQYRETILRMQALASTIDTSQRGHATLYPLMVLARAQSALDGRKAILLFSEGLQVPSSVEESFRTAISEANRANVSIYAIDARGLDTARDLQAAGAALEKASRISQQAVGQSGADPTSMDEMLNDDRVVASLRSSTQSVLRELAESTGGVLVANSNDLGKGLDRVGADLASYYEIAYVPQSGEADGRFRKVDVKVARKGVDVTSRSGYFALPASDGTPLLPYELPLLAAAAATPAPRAFDFQASAFRFHETTARAAVHAGGRGPGRRAGRRRGQEDAAVSPPRRRDGAGQGRRRRHRGAPQQHLPARRPAGQPAWRCSAPTSCSSGSSGSAPVATRSRPSSTIGRPTRSASGSCRFGCFRSRRASTSARSRW